MPLAVNESSGWRSLSQRRLLYLGLPLQTVLLLGGVKHPVLLDCALVRYPVLWGYSTYLTHVQSCDRSALASASKDCGRIAEDAKKGTVFLAWF